MSEPEIVHMNQQHSWLTTACGIDVIAPKRTTDWRKVTCKRCEKTQRFVTAVLRYDVPENTNEQ